MLTGTRLLIIEEEFLIALDIQRILEGADTRQTVFTRNFQEAGALADRFGEFDLAIVTAPRPGTPDVAVAEKLANSDLAIVVCTAARGSLEDTPLANAESLDKPYSDEALLAACARALARRAAIA